MKVQNQKSSNYKDEIQKKYFTGVKPEMTYITEGKILLTQNYIQSLTLLTFYSSPQFKVMFRKT